MKAVFIGTGGLAKQCIELIEKNSDSVDIFFFDNTEHAPKEFYGFPVINELANFSDEPFAFGICIGAPKWRKHYHEYLVSLGGFPIVLMDPNCKLSEYAEIDVDIIALY
jgi:hypothetical protein